MASGFFFGAFDFGPAARVAAVLQFGRATTSLGRRFESHRVGTVAGRISIHDEASGSRE